MTNSVQVEPESDINSCVIALHCSLSSGNQWASLAEHLAGKHRFFAPDISGYGSNPGPFELPSTLAEEAALLVKALGDATGPIHLVGHSYGGAVAFKIATDSPLAGRVRSLTLIEPVLPTILMENGADRRLYDHFVHVAHTVYEDLWNGLAWEAIEKFRAFWKGSAPSEEPSSKAIVRMVQHADKLAFDFTSIIAERDVTAAAAAIRVPTLLLSGGLSPYLTQRVVWRLASAIAGAETKHLPAAGHMLPISHASAVNPLIAQHIARADELAGLSLALDGSAAEAAAPAKVVALRTG
jgi:pimeloyl-ACP methyl ester carboxylesterase